MGRVRKDVVLCNLDKLLKLRRRLLNFRAMCMVVDLWVSGCDVMLTVLANRGV